MPRSTITTAYRDGIEAPSSTEIPVVFATLTHPQLIAPIRVNNDIVDYVYGGETFTGVGFHIKLLTDDDRPPQTQAAIANVDQSIGNLLKSLNSPLSVKIELLARSDFDSADPRMPIGTPSVQYSAPGLKMRNVSLDAMTITFDITGDDITVEPWPRNRLTRERTPAIFYR